MISCLAIVSNGCPSRAKSRFIGGLLEAGKASMERDCFSTKQNAVTISQLMQLRMKLHPRSENGPLSRNGEKSLDHNSQTNDPAKARAIFEGQLRECYGRVVYSHKTHEKCADILLARLGQIKFVQILLSALTTAGFVSAILGSGKTGATIGVVISTALLVLNAYTKNYDLGELAQKHKQAANDIWLIREKYLSLLTDLAMGHKPLDALQEERDILIQSLHAAYTGSPSTTHEAYKKAQVALKQSEDMTFSEAEIDAFLPKELKRNTVPGKG